jgi:hypothetical protein
MTGVRLGGAAASPLWIRTPLQVLWAAMLLGIGRRGSRAGASPVAEP